MPARPGAAGALGHRQGKAHLDRARVTGTKAAARAGHDNTEPARAKRGGHGAKEAARTAHQAAHAAARTARQAAHAAASTARQAAHAAAKTAHPAAPGQAAGRTPTTQAASPAEASASGAAGSLRATAESGSTAAAPGRVGAASVSTPAPIRPAASTSRPAAPARASDLIGAAGRADATVSPTLLGLLAVTHAAGRPVSPAASRHSSRSTSRPGGSLYDEPLVLAGGRWPGISLQAATKLTVPILFGAVVALFVLVQALIDRRDPKLARAPERGEDDTVGFG